MPVVPNMVQGEDGEYHVVKETRSDCLPDSTGSRTYDLVAQFRRFPLSSEAEVERWADHWFDWKSQRNRIEVRSGKHLRKIWKSGKGFRQVIEKALRGETLFTERELVGVGAEFLTLLSHFHWEELAALAEATKATVESVQFDAGISAKKDIVTLNAFMELSRTGQLPTKAEVKATVRESIKSVSDSNFTKIFNKIGLAGLPDAPRGPDASSQKRVRAKA